MKDFKPQAWLLPQPVVIIGTYNDDGNPNAMNAAWVGQWDTTQIAISIGAHVTTQNLVRNPDFTITFATEDTLVGADFVGITSAKNCPEKVRIAGWHHSRGANVNAPVFSDFPMTLECRVKQIFDLTETGGYVLADIINIVCDERFIAEDGKPDVEKMRLITYDPIHHNYITLGTAVGKAFHDGKRLK